MHLYQNRKLSLFQEICQIKSRLIQLKATSERYVEFRSRFYDVLSHSDDMLYGLLESAPEINSAFKAYNKLKNTSFDWKSHISLAVIQDYVNFIGTPGTWLLPSELAIIAQVFHRKVIYFSGPDCIEPEVFNLTQIETVVVRFDGINHYEQMCPSNLHSKLTQKDSPLVSDLSSTATEEITTPLIAQFSVLTINDPNVLATFEAFRAALAKHDPVLSKAFDESGVLTVERGVSALTLSCSSGTLKPSRPEEAQPDLSSPKNLSKKFEKVVSDKKVAEKSAPDPEKIKHIQKLEHSFQCNYDDSSDSEDEVDSVHPKIDLDKFKANIAAGSEKYKDCPYWKISFYLHVLGIMIIRSIPVNQHYQRQKNQYLKLSDGDFRLFKEKFFDVIQEQNLGQQVDRRNFEENIWPLFLENFRRFSKTVNSLDKILEKSLKEILIHLFGQKTLSADKKIILQGLVDKIKPYLLKRIYVFNGEISINNQSNVDHQIMMVIRFLYRLTRRNSKSFTAGTPDSTFKIKFHTTDMKEKFHLKTYERGWALRTDEMDLGFKGTSYPDLLSSNDKNGVRRFASVAKYTVPYASRSQREFTNEIRSAAYGESLSDNSYVNFLRKFYYLLQRCESGRNPASLIINLMLFKLISTGEYQWSDVLPANDEQKNMFATTHPDLVHPMTFRDAPKAAAVLMEDFHDVVEPSLRYYPHQETRGKTINDARVIAKKQYHIVDAWFSYFKEKSIDNVTDKKIVEALCEMANKYYFPQ